MQPDKDGLVILDVPSQLAPYFDSAPTLISDVKFGEDTEDGFYRFLVVGESGSAGEAILAFATFTLEDFPSANPIISDAPAVWTEGLAAVLREAEPTKQRARLLLREFGDLVRRRGLSRALEGS